MNLMRLILLDNVLLVRTRHYGGASALSEQHRRPATAMARAAKIQGHGS